MTASTNTPRHAPEAPPPSRSGRFWLPVVALAALAVLLVGGYAALTRTSNDKADPATSPAPAVLGGAPAAIQASAAPSASASVSASASASAKPSAKASKKAATTTESGHEHYIAGWPGPKNTGVPAGTKLSTYTGPCTIQKAGTVIDAKTLNCDLTILAADVTVKRSKINGLVFLDTDRAGSSNWSLTLEDSEVDAGKAPNAAVSYGNMTLLRDNIHGGVTSAQCGEKSSTCVIQDSYLHGQYLPATAAWHLGGFLSNGGHNIRIRHNYILCEPPANSVGEGCTGDLNLLPDFAVIADVIAEDNFLGANTGSSYCIYGGDSSTKPYPHANHVVIRNNTFERGTNGKCGMYGPVTGFNSNGTGNIWTGNKWRGGGSVAPEN